MKESIKVRLKQLQRISGRIFRSRLLVLMGVFCLTSSMLVCRCFYLQIIKGEEYAEEYELRIKKTEEIKATRGNIYDRNGNLLAYNELAYSITIEDPTSSDSSVSERNETINAILEQVLEIVEENGDSVINSFGITLDSSGNYQFSQTNETQRLRFVADVYGYSSADDLTDEQKNQTADDIIEYLCTDEIYGYGLDYSGSDQGYILDMVNMRYAMHLNSYQKYMSTTIATGVSRETAAAVMENKDVLTGVDIVGKSGIEKAFDDILRGTNGETTFYVDNVGNVTETLSTTEPTAGNDLWLTIDSSLQNFVYQLVEEKLAGIILSKLQNVLTYDASTAEDSSDIIIPVGDAYYSMIGNSVIDYTEFGDEDAGEAEQEVYGIFMEKRASVCEDIMEQLSDSDAASNDSLTDEMQDYMDYVCDTVLTENTGILDSGAVDYSDDTYTEWSQGNISLYAYLNYAISRNWINTVNLSGSSYSSSAEIYQAILDYVEEYIESDSGLTVLLYMAVVLGIPPRKSHFTVRCGYIS